MAIVSPVDGHPDLPHSGEMDATPFALDAIAHTIQLALAPSFLLTAIAAILALLTGRLGRAVDRSRWIEQNYAPAGDPRHDNQVHQLRLIDLRMRYANRALILCTLSAVMICVVVAGIFTAALFSPSMALGQALAIAFIAAMLLLIVGLGLFLMEVRIAGYATRIQDALLERA